MSNVNAAQMLAGLARPDFEVISHWIDPSEQVLDLGCGDGTLLAKLTREKFICGYGVENNDANVAACVAKGLNVLQQNLEGGLSWFDAGQFDVVVMSLTLQAVHNTEHIMREVMRVGRRAIVSVPNFGHWAHRLSVLRGRMPVSKTLPYEWYNTPNVRVLTLADFEILARDLGCTISRRAVLHGDEAITWLPNLRGSLAVFELSHTADA